MPPAIPLPCFLNYKCPLPHCLLLSLILTQTSTMLPNQNFHIHNNHMLSYSCPPTLCCLYCLQHFQSRTGCTRHKVKHADVLSSDTLTPPTLPTQSLIASSDNSNSEPQQSNEVTSHHSLLCFTVQMSITQTLIGMMHNPCLIPILSLKYTDSPHQEGISMFLNLHISLKHIMRR